MSLSWPQKGYLDPASRPLRLIVQELAATIPESVAPACCGAGQEVGAGLSAEGPRKIPFSTALNTLKHLGGIPKHPFIYGFVTKNEHKWRIPQEWPYFNHVFYRGLSTGPLVDSLGSQGTTAWTAATVATASSGAFGLWWFGQGHGTGAGWKLWHGSTAGILHRVYFTDQQDPTGPDLEVDSLSGQILARRSPRAFKTWTYQGRSGTFSVSHVHKMGVPRPRWLPWEFRVLPCRSIGFRNLAGAGDVKSEIPWYSHVFYWLVITLPCFTYSNGLFGFGVSLISRQSHEKSWSWSH